MGPRIAVKGASGSGKTTLAAELARRLGIPHIELDALHHGPNWSEASAEEFRARVRAAMKSSPDGWVIDGNYERKLDSLVTDAADLIVWLDLPLPLLLLRLWRRTSGRIRSNEELWNGNRESWRTALWGRESLFVWTMRSYFRHRAEWPRRFASHPRFVRLRTARAAHEWLQQVQHRSDEMAALPAASLGAVEAHYELMQPTNQDLAQLLESNRQLAERFDSVTIGDAVHARCRLCSADVAAKEPNTASDSQPQPGNRWLVALEEHTATCSAL